MGGNDEAHDSCCVDYVLRYRERDGAVVRKPGGEQGRQAASRRGENELREQMQKAGLRKQGGEQRGKAASRRSQKQLHGKMQALCLSKTPIFNLICYNFCRERVSK